jgi:hypothetical protein
VYTANRDDDDFNCDTLGGREGSNNLLYGVIGILAFAYNTGSQTMLCGDLMFHKPEQNNLPLKSGNGDLTIRRKRIVMDKTSHNIM